MTPYKSTPTRDHDFHIIQKNNVAFNSSFRLNQEEIPKFGFNKILLLNIGFISRS